ncbi:MAG: DUF1178 family protein [Rhodobacteraceae bacterium]|nr:DUF1178 family protein [Paracoccaceae bacterium]
MIRYALRCAKGHSFDSWFGSASAFDRLAEGGHLACAVCGGTDVSKAPMAPAVTQVRKTAAAPSPAAPTSVAVSSQELSRPLSQPLSAAEQAMAELRARIERETEDVGRRFADEARAIHEGHAPERAIRGQARPEDARALLEDGVPVMPLPWPGNRRAN